ncbi:MAG: ribbon-helix-helix domain-containing protein [Bacteroidales bacterium]|nr:ribbon-helix-helix domain-containing protein [Bacteroidales bacterium]
MKTVLQKRMARREPTTCKLSFKLTERERIDFDRMMSEEGYRNRSLFIRDRVFSIKPGSRKVRSADAGQESSGSYASLVSHIRKIGVNVNTACHNINASASRNNAGELDSTMQYWLKKVSSYLYRITVLLEKGDSIGNTQP